MLNKIIILVYICCLITTATYAETSSGHKQSTTGDQSPAIHAGGDVNVNYGLTKEQYAEMLREQEERLVKKLQLPNTIPGKQHLLEQELKSVQEKLANLQTSYEEEKRRRKAADRALEQFKEQLPSAQIEKARTSLQQGNTKAAEKAFDDIVKNGSGVIALAAYHSAQLAEGRVGYAKAMRQYKKAVMLDEDNPEYLFKAGRMASTVADYKQAQEWLEHLLNIRKAKNKNGINFAYASHALANLYQRQGKYEEAEPLYKRSLAITEKALGKKHSAIANTLSNLALLYRQQGKYEKAEPLYKQSLAIKEKALGKEHPLVATILNNLAELYDQQGKHKKAQPLYKRSLAITEKALGKEHPSVATTLNNLAELYDQQGEYEKAELLYIKSLSILKTKSPNRHPDIDVVQTNYIYLLINRYLKSRMD